MHDSVFQSYWKQVAQHVTCSGKRKQQFREEAYQSVREYFLDCADEGASVESFLGAPDELAATLMGTLDQAEVEKARRRNRWQPRIIAAAAVLCLVVPLPWRICEPIRCG